MRVVTINMWGDHAPLERRLQLAAEALAALRPDAVLMQEARRGVGLACTADALAERIADRTGLPWLAQFATATAGPAGTWGPGSGDGEEGLAVLAPSEPEALRVVELPDARPKERRILLSVRLGARWLHTTHLHWRPRDADARARQVQAIVDELAALGPGPHLVGGDFNATADAPELRPLRAALVDAYAAARPGDPGVTWAARNPGIAPFVNLLAPDRRIDLVFVSRDTRVRDARVVLDTPDAQGVFPSDHFGVLVEID